ncbi:uncharacterized protein [Miscanthus floridulus]|uniref:uncharacterized protein n=1 Tax=Miscanthus floridulus TaxID=154761 RepID=UPI00345A268C
MLRRAATTATLNDHAAAWFRRLTRRPVTLPPAHLGRHYRPQAQLQPPRAVVSAPPLPRLLCGARGYSYRRMARRIPIARPDEYSSSDGEAEDPDAREAAGEITEPVGGEGAEGDDDSEGSEVEGFMLDLGSLSGSGDEEGTEEGGK